MLTAERLRALVHYDPKTGRMYWRETRGQQVRGEEVGRRLPSGYYRVQIDRKCYYLHRLTYLYVHGAWPQGHTERLNRDDLDGVPAWTPPQRSTELTTEIVRRLLDYDPETGVFTWRERVGNIPAGSRAGYLQTLGYWMIRITVGGHQHHMRASRLAWQHYHGSAPIQEIDHINGRCDDDRIVNLREADRSQQLANSKLSRRNTSGFRGVWKKRDRWMAQTKWHGKTIRFGCFDTPEEAHAAWLKGTSELHGEFRRAA
jgi:hypothetical protein